MEKQSKLCISVDENKVCVPVTQSQADAVWKALGILATVAVGAIVIDAIVKA